MVVWVGFVAVWVVFEVVWVPWGLQWTLFAELGLCVWVGCSILLGTACSWEAFWVVWVSCPAELVVFGVVWVGFVAVWVVFEVVWVLFEGVLFVSVQMLWVLVVVLDLCVWVECSILLAKACLWEVFWVVLVACPAELVVFVVVWVGFVVAWVAFEGAVFVVVWSLFAELDLCVWVGYSILLGTACLWEAFWVVLVVCPAELLVFVVVWVGFVVVWVASEVVWVLFAAALVLSVVVLGLCV